MPDIDISVLLRRSNGWDKSLNGQIKLRNCSLLQITVAVQAICKCWQADWCIVKLRESQVGDTVKVNKERDLSRCGLLTQIQHSTHPSTLSSSPFFYPPKWSLTGLNLYAIYSSSFTLTKTLTGIVRCWAMIVTTKSGYEDKCNSFSAVFFSNLSFWLPKQCGVMDRVG